MDQEVHDLAREGVGWRSRAATVWPVAATNTGRELGLGHCQLVSQYVRPDRPSVVRAVGRMGDTGPERATVREVERVAQVMRTGPASRLADNAPTLVLAELGVIRSCRRRPIAHAEAPTSHFFSWSSSLKETSCTSAQLSRWLGAWSRWSCHCVLAGGGVTEVDLAACRVFVKELLRNRLRGVCHGAIVPLLESLSREVYFHRRPARGGAHWPRRRSKR